MTECALCCSADYIRRCTGFAKRGSVSCVCVCASDVTLLGESLQTRARARRKTRALRGPNVCAL
jgi:hypothetical protein